MIWYNTKHSAAYFCLVFNVELGAGLPHPIGWQIHVTCVTKNSQTKHRFHRHIFDSTSAPLCFFAQTANHVTSIPKELERPFFGWTWVLNRYHHIQGTPKTVLFWQAFQDFSCFHNHLNSLRFLITSNLVLFRTGHLCKCIFFTYFM